MSFNKKYNVTPEFESLFELSPQSQNELDALLLVAKFLSNVTDVLTERKITRKELAQQIGVSASWLTQIFRGDKLPNWDTLAKIKNALAIDFEITLKNQTISAIYTDKERENRSTLNFPRRQEVFTGFYKSLRPNLEEETDEFTKISKKDNVLIA